MGFVWHEPESWLAEHVLGMWLAEHMMGLWLAGHTLDLWLAGLGRQALLCVRYWVRFARQTKIHETQVPDQTHRCLPQA